MSEKRKATKETLVIRTEASRRKALQAVSMIVLDPDLPWLVTIEQSKEARRLKQNRLSFLWYGELGQQSGEGKIHWRCFCKLTYGVPILRAGDADIDDHFSRILDPLPYEAQLDAMEYIDVTSLMSVREFAEYLTDVDMAAGSIGFKLTHPDELYWDSLMKEAERHE